MKDFVNIGEGTFSKIWAGSRCKSEIPKTWKGLRNMPRHRIKNKTEVHNFYTSVPFRTFIFFCMQLSYDPVNLRFLTVPL